MICRQKRKNLNPGPAPALQAVPAPEPQPPARRRKPPNPWIMPWILQTEERGCYRTLLADLIQTDIPVYQNFVRMPPIFFLTSLRNAYTPTSRTSVTNFRKPLEAGLKLAKMLRHLATGETYSSLQYHLLVVQITIM